MKSEINIRQEINKLVEELKETIALIHSGHPEDKPKIRDIEVRINALRWVLNTPIVKKER